MKMTIDLGAAAHQVRRRLFKLFRTPQTLGRCYDCGKALSYEECRYYHTACERCEGINHEQMDAALRAGGVTPTAHQTQEPQS